MSQLSRVDRLKVALANAKGDLKHSAKIGTGCVVTSLGGGVIGGYLNAKYPNVLNTTVSSAGALGAGLVLLGMSGVADEHSDVAAQLGSGLLAAAIADEAEKYFSAH